MKLVRMMVAGALFTLSAMPTWAEELTQNITPGYESVNVLPGDSFELPLFYSSDKENSTGVGVTLSFDDKKLKFTGFSNTYQDGLIAVDKAARSLGKPVDANNEINTGANVAWMSIDGVWPEAGNTSVALTVAHFNVLDVLDSDTYIAISGEAAAKAVVPEKTVSITIGQGNSLAVNNTSGSGSFSWLFLPLFLLLVLNKAYQARK